MGKFVNSTSLMISLSIIRCYCNSIEHYVTTRGFRYYAVLTAPVLSEKYFNGKSFMEIENLINVTVIY